MKMEKRELYVFILVFIIVALVAFFYPKPSSHIETEYAVQSRVNQGMSLQDSQKQSLLNNIICTCLGIEIAVKATSYTTDYVCYGLVTVCEIAN